MIKRLNVYIIKDLPSVLILIIADNFLNDSLCCSYKYEWCVRMGTV